jgi:hypothetical protein
LSRFLQDLFIADLPDAILGGKSGGNFLRQKNICLNLALELMLEKQ